MQTTTVAELLAACTGQVAANHSPSTGEGMYWKCRPTEIVLLWQHSLEDLGCGNAQKVQSYDRCQSTLELGYWSRPLISGCDRSWGTRHCEIAGQEVADTRGDLPRAQTRTCTGTGHAQHRTCTRLESSGCLSSRASQAWNLTQRLRMRRMLYSAGLGMLDNSSLQNAASPQG